MRQLVPSGFEISVAMRARAGFAFLVERYGLPRVQEVVQSEKFNIGCKCNCALALITGTNDYESACSILKLDPFGMDTVIMGFQTTEVFVEGEPKTEEYWLEIDSLNDAWREVALAGDLGDTTFKLAA